MTLSNDAISLAREAVDSPALGVWWEDPGSRPAVTPEPPENQAVVLLLAEVAIRLERLEDRINNIELSIDASSLGGK
jgi:hypothetical protein